MKYPGDWQATEIRGKQAKVAFSHKELPDYDVTLQYDELRQQWKVISVAGGGFPSGTFSAGFFQ